MWYIVENGESIRPADVDTTSSKAYVYVRKNFKLIPEQVTEMDTIPAHYRWQEIKIPKEMWEVSRSVFEHESALNDVYDALTELAEIVTEV